MGDGAPRVPIVGETSPAHGSRGAVGIAGSAHDDALAEFKRAVRERQIEYLVNVKKRSFIPDIPAKELESIEPGGKDRMRKEAALACRALLAAARTALGSAQGAGDAVAGGTSAIGIQSAYRNFREDTAAWEKTFGQYYQKMVEEETFAGNELGPQALNFIVKQMILYKAPPGYSNHSNGLAVDFNTMHARVKYEAKKAQNEGWTKTWFYRWLTAKSSASPSVTNAASFGFKPLATEAWHWDYDASLRKPAKT